MPKEKYQNFEQDRRITFLEEKFAVINSELGNVKIDVAQIKADVNWMKWWIKLTAGAAISGLIIGVVNLLGK